MTGIDFNNLSRNFDREKDDLLHEKDDEIRRLRKQIEVDRSEIERLRY